MAYKASTAGEHRRWYLYVLKLENEKYYVGITSKTPEVRFQEHVIKKRGAYWTMAYKPLSIELTEDLGIVSKQHAEEYENKVTRQLMKERGINNVRGGDLRDTEEYVKRFGWLYLKNQWEIITIVALQTVIILYLLIDKYFL